MRWKLAKYCLLLVTLPLVVAGWAARNRAVAPLYAEPAPTSRLVRVRAGWFHQTERELQRETLAHLVKRNTNLGRAIGGDTFGISSPEGTQRGELVSLTGTIKSGRQLIGRTQFHLPAGDGWLIVTRLGTLTDPDQIHSHLRSLCRAETAPRSDDPAATVVIPHVAARGTISREYRLSAAEQEAVWWQTRTDWERLYVSLRGADCRRWNYWTTGFNYFVALDEWHIEAESEELTTNHTNSLK